MAYAARPAGQALCRISRADVWSVPYKHLRRRALRTCEYQGVRNVRFSENLDPFFLETLVLRFDLLPDYRRVNGLLKVLYILDVCWGPGYVFR